MATFEDFQKLDIRTGKIVKVELLENAKYTTHKLTIDFGRKIGKKISCARLVNYSPDELRGKLIIGAVNLPPKRIGPEISEVLTLGVPDGKGECILVVPDGDTPLGSKLY